MSERPIPEDVMVVARHEAQFFADWLHHGNSTGSLSEHAIAGLADSIARALMAERERCAAIAERDTDWPRFGKMEIHQPWDGGPDDARDYRVGIVAGRAIAAAIRRGGQ